MRRKMREVFDELWIIDLEGDSLGARKTENVFAIRISVAIAIGVQERITQPQAFRHKVWKTKLTGPEPAKLESLDDAADRFADLDWRRVLRTSGIAPFYPAGSGNIF